MPLAPSFLERLLFLGMNRGPGLLFDVFGAGAFRAVSAALTLGMFEAIGSDRLTSTEIATRSGADERGTTILLEFLRSLRYVRREGGHYVNTSMTKKWLLRSSDTCLADMVSVWDTEVFEFWDEHLVEAVKNGKPGVSLYNRFDTQPDAWRRFNSFEMAVANWIKGPLLSRARLPKNARRLLDVGGGHGMYSIMFCQKYPELSATIFDRPEPLKLAQTNIDTHGMSARINLQAGDFLVDELGDGYDVALLFNIIHNFGAKENVLLLGKVSRALNPEGLVIVFDNIPGPGVSNTIIDFFRLTYFVTVGGQTYSINEIKRWFEEAGLSAPRPSRLFPGLVLSTKAS